MFSVGERSSCWLGLDLCMKLELRWMSNAHDMRHISVFMTHLHYHSSEHTQRSCVFCFVMSSLLEFISFFISLQLCRVHNMIV